MSTPGHSQGDLIDLIVHDPNGSRVAFRLKRSTQLKKLMSAYCDRLSVDIPDIVFLFKGLRLREDMTPNELEMEDDDEIHALLRQTREARC